MLIRWIFPSFVLLLPLAGQVPLRPKAILEVGQRYLGPGSHVFVTNSGRVLAFAQARGDAPEDRLAIWDETTGALQRTTLDPLEEDANFLGGCGGDGSVQSVTTLHSNLSQAIWNPDTRRFRLLGEDGGPTKELSEAGEVIPGETFHPPAAQVESLSPNAIRIVPPQASAWVASLPMPPGAESIASKPIRRILVGRLGFQHVLADREGRWLVATWEGSVPSRAPNRSAVPFRRDRNPRWLLFEQGSPLPVMDVPLGAILGGTHDPLKLTLSTRGDRILVEVGPRVIVFDPFTRSLVSNRQAHLLAELPERNQALLQDRGDGTLRRLDLDSGSTLGAFQIPETLDVPEAGLADPTLALPARSLGAPIAFSPDGRYMVTPRWGRHGFHWDGLVIWDLDGTHPTSDPVGSHEPTQVPPTKG